MESFLFLFVTYTMSIILVSLVGEHCCGKTVGIVLGLSGLAGCKTIVDIVAVLVGSIANYREAAVVVTRVVVDS